MDERRNYIRIDRSMSVGYRVVKHVLGSGARSRNISAGGICLPMQQRFEVGVMLELTIDIAEINTISAIGQVVWTKFRDDIHFPFELGIKFIKIARADREKLIAHISKLGPGDVKLI